MEMMVAAGEVVGLLGKDNVCSFHPLRQTTKFLISRKFLFPIVFIPIM